MCYFRVENFFVWLHQHSSLPRGPILLTKLTKSAACAFPAPRHRFWQELTSMNWPQGGLKSCQRLNGRNKKMGSVFFLRFYFVPKIKQIGRIYNFSFKFKSRWFESHRHKLSSTVTNKGLIIKYALYCFCILWWRFKQGEKTYLITYYNIKNRSTAANIGRG